MRFLLPSLTLLAFALPAHAAPCERVAEAGECQDAKTLAYCADGELQVERCASGEVCIDVNERFGGAAGCLPTHLAGCGAIPEEGSCAGAILLACVEGSIEEHPCPTGTTCQVREADGLHIAVCAEADESIGEDAEIMDGALSPDSVPILPEEPEAMDSAEPPPGPSFSQGGVEPNEPELAAVGCQGGSPLTLGWLLMLLPFLRSRRKG